MNTHFNPQGITLQLTSDELTELYNYAVKCLNEGFEGINNFERTNSEREFFYKWMLRDLIYQLFSKAFKQITGNQKKYRLTITLAHQKTLSMMFKRVESSAFLLTIQSKLLHQLQKTY